MTAHRSPKKYLFLGTAGLVLLVCVFGLWSATQTMSGAVIIPAHFDTGKQRQVIQHPHGGVIEDIAVTDGAQTRHGDVLITLRQPDWTAQRKAMFGNLIALQARKARLQAEHRGDALTFPPDLTAAAATIETGERSLANETALFQSQGNLHQQTLLQLETQDQQIQDQAAGLHAQKAALETLISLVSEDLATQKSLFEKGLTQAFKVSALDQQLALHARDMAQIDTQVAQLGSQGAQLQLSKLRLESDRRQKAAAELRDIDVQIAQLREDLSALDARLATLMLRAPMAGIVHGIAPLTTETIVSPGAPLFEILPDDGTLRAVGQVTPDKIDLIHFGQDVRLQLSDFDPQNAPELTGRVSQISADAIQDATTGVRTFRVEITIGEAALASLDPSHKVQPGMSAQAFILTQDRTLLSILTSPLAGYFQKAFKDG